MIVGLVVEVVPTVVGQIVRKLRHVAQERGVVRGLQLPDWQQRVILAVVVPIHIGDVEINFLFGQLLIHPVFALLLLKHLRESTASLEAQWQ